MKTKTLQTIFDTLIEVLMMAALGIALILGSLEIFNWLDLWRFM